jgi:ABC-2 type transport system ATP-binding protein
MSGAGALSGHATAAREPVVRVERLSKWYGDVLGLNEVTLDLHPGVTGLLGPNGAGKSTLLKVMCGMLRPSLGTVRIHGMEPFENPAVMPHLGLCPEQDPAYPGIACWSVLAYLTRLHGYARAEAKERARVVLERVGLGHVLDRSVTTFSKGMRQRFKLAQALAHDPDVVILDEPLNGLDPPGRRDLSEVIHALGEEGRTVLVSSHVLHEVESLARQIVFLHQGRVLAEGTREQIRSELPEHPLEVRLSTPDPKALATRLLEAPGVVRVERLEQAVRVLTTKPEAFFDHLGTQAGSGGPAVTAVIPGDEDLEAVFRYLTR